MLSDTIRAMRQEALDAAHGGIVMSGDDLIGYAARLAAIETEARNLEQTVARQISDTRFAALLAQRGNFGRRVGRPAEAPNPRFSTASAAEGAKR